MKMQSWSELRKNRAAIGPAEQALWSLSNMTVLVIVAVFGTVEEVSDVVPPLVHLSLIGAVARASVYDARWLNTNTRLPRRLAVSSVAVLAIAGLASIVARRLLVADSDSIPLAIEAVAIVVMVLEADLRSFAHQIGHYTTAVLSDSVWLVSLAPITVALSTIGNDLPVAVLSSWVAGAGLAMVHYSFALRREVAIRMKLDQSSSSSIAEFLLSSAPEQLAFVLNATRPAVAELRLAFTVAGPLNQINMGRRTVSLSEGTDKVRSRSARSSRMILFIVAAGALTTLAGHTFARPETVPNTLLRTSFLLPQVVVYRAIVGELGVASTAIRQKFGGVRTGMLRGAHGIVLLFGFLIFESPAIAISAAMVAALVTLLATEQLFRRVGENALLRP